CWQYIAVAAVADETMRKAGHKQPEEGDRPHQRRGDGDEDGDNHEKDDYRAAVVYAQTDRRRAPEREHVEGVSHPPQSQRDEDDERPRYAEQCRVDPRE